MPCEGCLIQFSVFRRRRSCPGCGRWYCASCVRRGAGLCAPCRILCSRPLLRQHISHLKPKDLQSFLQRQNVSTRGCVEKDDLVSLCVNHVNSNSFRRQSPTSAGPFSTLKGFTSNINDYLVSAFDLRSNQQPPQPPPRNHRFFPSPMSAPNGCFNSTHRHEGVVPEELPVRPEPPRNYPEPVRPSTSYAGPGPPQSPEESSEPISVRVDTTDCFEIEDLDDSAWEIVYKPGQSLPNDSEVLLSVNDQSLTSEEIEQHIAEEANESVEVAEELSQPGTPARASSEIDLRSHASPEPDTASLKDEPFVQDQHGAAIRVCIEDIKDESQLGRLSVRQLKELLVMNRVAFSGCVERSDLLQRAITLWRDHLNYRGKIEDLSLEESCKICMAAPLECVLLECGHMAACTKCAKQLAECPICRQFVLRAVRFFRA